MKGKPIVKVIIHRVPFTELEMQKYHEAWSSLIDEVLGKPNVPLKKQDSISEEPENK